MNWIRWIEADSAEGDLAELYSIWHSANPERDDLPGILKCFSWRPDFLRQVMDFSQTIQFSDGHLDRSTKELLATFVSALNQCPY